MKALLIIALLLVGCTPSQEEMEATERENYIPVKPFVIYDKSMNTDEVGCFFYYYDINRKKLDFQDFCNKYSIGDTIK